MRGISTVIDGTLFLLVVGVAVATLVGVSFVTDEAATDRADTIVEHLATGTERVDYSLAPAARDLAADPPRPIHDGPPYERSAHGTLASLLADATVATVAVDGQRISREGDAFEAAVVDATERRIHQRNVSVHVHAVWEPYPDAPIGGGVSVGEQPPATLDVNAATVRVSGPIPDSRQRAIDAARSDGFRGVARAAADATVQGLFPPNRTRLALRGDYPVDALVATRYAAMVRAVSDEQWYPPSTSDVGERNAELSALVADRLASDLRERFDSPETAARSVSTGVVTVTVRTWSR